MCFEDILVHESMVFGGEFEEGENGCGDWREGVGEARSCLASNAHTCGFLPLTPNNLL